MPKAPYIFVTAKLSSAVLGSSGLTSNDMPEMLISASKYRLALSSIWPLLSVLAHTKSLTRAPAWFGQRSTQQTIEDGLPIAGEVHFNCARSSRIARLGRTERSQLVTASSHFAGQGGDVQLVTRNLNREAADAADGVPISKLNVDVSRQIVICTASTAVALTEIAVPFCD